MAEERGGRSVGNGSMSVVCQSREPREGRERGPVLMGISGLWWGIVRTGILFLSFASVLVCLLFTAGAGTAMVKWGLYFALFY